MRSDTRCVRRVVETAAGGEGVERDAPLLRRRHGVDELAATEGIAGGHEGQEVAEGVAEASAQVGVDVAAVAHAV